MTARRDWHDHYRANFRKWKMVFLKISFGVEGRERVAADAAESVERAITARARSGTRCITLNLFTLDADAARFPLHQFRNHIQGGFLPNDDVIHRIYSKT
ncbi:MAG: hypothetical protein HZB77_12930 [Chloroflexi bacterium]|nr:hypothetical protein [Chloroflexota bacterium]